MANGSRIPAFVNPGSGNYEKAREALLPSGRFDVRDVEPEALEQEIRRAVDSGARRVLVAGGDGSICAGAAVVSGTDVELAVIPAGTLNHFARDTGIPTDLLEAAAVSVGETTIFADVGRVGDRVFLNTSAIGAYVNFVRIRERLEPRFGYALASFIASLRIFMLMPAITIEFEAEGAVQRFRTPLVFIGVGERELQVPAFGSRVKGGQRALHVMIVRGRRRGRLLMLAFAAAARGVKGASKSPQLDSFLVDRCTIYMRRREATVALDGEMHRLGTPLEYRIDLDALKVVVPAVDRTEPAPAASAT